MRIAFTPKAETQIRLAMADQPFLLKLAYDTEGCGCAVSGIAQLWAVERPAEHDIEAEGTPLPIVYDKRQEVFFEEELTVDYLPEHLSYVLKSRQQIYNARMSLTDRRATQHI